ncbi:hypothetical protein SRRS_08030 [Sporomusa rhizae]|uniref:AraC family transcriptional regulator n=1 Tax=Sporomusa rhizae TaxID=357999 RepID=UPI00352AD854
MNNKVIKVPHELEVNPYGQDILKLGGFSVVETCSFINRNNTGSMFLEDHLLLFVLHGSCTLRYGDTEYAIGKNEMALLQKSIVVEYQLSSDLTNARPDYMMFFFKNELLSDFIRMADMSITRPAISVPISVATVGDCLLRYIESLRPSFTSPEKVNDNWVKLKLLELLFDIANEDQQMMRQLLQLNQPVRSNIVTTMEANLFNPVSLSDLAYLSGRSLASFKRDFYAIYNTPPARWLREKRLHKAKEMLANSSMSVTSVCFATGFESVAHFSRSFKEYFGTPPSLYK